MKTLLLLATLVLAYRVEAFKNLYKDTNKLLRARPGADVGDPLILTPYLKLNKILEAQAAAKVEHPSFLNVTSYAGYFTVDERYDSNIWFWYFPSADKPTDDPVVLWLNGGPGASSLNGLFDENGPFIVGSDGSVSLREYSWHKNHSLLFVDNPVGVGYSFTNGNGLARNETKVGEDMHSALTQFFQLFPALQKNTFFISGESYSGKYLPAIGYTILKKNPIAESKINLQGILIGDGWTDPINQLNYGPFLYNTGLISASVKEQIDQYRDNAIKLIQAGEYSAADEVTNEIYSLVGSVSNVNIYNYVEKYDDPDVWPSYLNTDELRRAIHVGNIIFGDKGAGEALEDDISQSIAPLVEELLENYPVLLYTGQLDIICGYPMALDYIQKLNFTGIEEYRNSSRDIWYVNGEPAGYVRTGGYLTELLVRNSGHMVPRDQPRWAYDMLYKFTRNQPYA
ncbi:unnamed protein product [Ceutorhynchus assimilis]|uniref:Carboxypeptidase n=1 Tax=Ceutorhynchus assimilis TaxID=467358 RepID=A0A9P0DJF7_9CUCU|nr:unnamed protein product [Ceutorhynchus assimilis]